MDGLVMVGLKSLPLDARPREKLLARGPGALSDVELLALLLRTGIRGKHVVQFPTPDGLGTYAGAAVQVREDGAVLFDFNHPLAGQPVRFEVQLIGVL